MKESEMATIASLISRALKNHESETELSAVRADVVELTSQFPIHEID
jgi:glycine/serine hydroxymethyltransferase